MNQQHTPGPWKVKEHATSCDVRGHDLTVVCGVTMRANAAEEAANARLIAAAPDLLAACKSLTEELDRLAAAVYGEHRGDAAALIWGRAAIASAVIAKAEGRED